MEPPSAKLPVILDHEKKLKQATLPFEIMKIRPKIDSALMKSKMNNCSNEEDVEIVEIIETMVNEEKLESASLQMEIEDVSETVSKVENEVTNNITESDLVKYEVSNSSDIVLIKNPEDVIADEKVNEPVDEGRNDDNIEDDNMKTNKRKLEGGEKVKEQKPPKRVKLIYNVDKIKKTPDVNAYNVNSVTVECVDNVINAEKNLNCNNYILLKETAVVSNSHNAKCDIETNSGMNDNSGTLTRDKVMMEAGESDEVEFLNQRLSGDKVMPLDNTCEVEIMDVEGSSSLVELLTLDESCEKTGEENCISPGVKGEKCSPSGKDVVRHLTPKQLERKAEIAKRKEEIQQERERKKKEKDKMKQEKEEEKARLKQKKEEVKKKKREEKEKKRLAEIEIKNEERRKKEEEKRKKEEEKQEEKRKKEEQKLEEKRKKEEMQKKKEEEQEMQKKKITKEAEVFSSFFKKFDSKVSTIKEDNGLSDQVVFMPFAVRADMRLAPVNRNPMDEERRTKFEELYQAQTADVLYLSQLRSGVIIPKKSGNTWPLAEKYGDVNELDEVLVLEDEVIPEPGKKFNDRRPKLLQFNENRRPPYWGTWRKKSRNIRPRNPLGKDDIFDYEVDSDEEWEEEEPGESLHGSDDEKESEEDEYEVDNDFFVPHGYLSDDENPEDETLSPETQKAKLQLLGEQFNIERSEKTKLLKPILLGCLWFNNDSDEPASANPSIVRFLNQRKAVPWAENIPIPMLQDENTDPAEVALPEGGIPLSNKETLFPESAIPDLITLIYGSTNSRKNLAKMFLMHWNKKQEDLTGEGEVSTGVLSQARIAKKIKELAKWEEFPEEGPCNGKLCWYVRREVRKKFGLADLTVQTKGDDTTEGRDLDTGKKVSPSLITKFTKVLTEDERRNQITKTRKSLLVTNQSTESVPNRPKQVAPLRCIQKLKGFWPEASVLSKYIPTKSVDTDEVIIVDPPAEMEATAEASNDKSSGKEVSSRGDDGPPPPAATFDDRSKGETKSPTKKRVAILFSVPRGCDIIKETSPRKPEVSVDDVIKKYSRVEDEISE